MNKLQEIYACKFGLITEKQRLPKYAVGKLLYNFAKADEQNLNYRIYTEKLLTREITKKSEELRSEKIAGQLDHPLEGITRLDKAAHILNSVSYDPKTKLASASSFILDTTGGRNFMTLLDSGVKMGASMRGFGTVATDKKVNDDWNLDSIDFVLKPSFAPEAIITKDNLIESVDSLEREKKEVDEEFISELQGRVYDQMMSFLPTSQSPVPYDEWLKKNGVAIRATALVEEFHVYDSVEEALIQMGETDTLHKMKGEEKIHTYTAASCFVEARIMGISPDLMAERLNKAEELKRVNLESGFPEKEALKIIEEARSAGVDMSDPVERKKHLDFVKEQRYSEPTLHERSLQLQEKMKAKGKEVSLETVQRVIIFDDEERAIEKRRMAIKGQVMREMVDSGAYTTKEEAYRHVNRELRKANLPILNEDGE